MEHFNLDNSHEEPEESGLTGEESTALLQDAFANEQDIPDKDSERIRNSIMSAIKDGPLYSRDRKLPHPEIREHQETEERERLRKLLEES